MRTPRPLAAAIIAALTLLAVSAAARALDGGVLADYYDNTLIWQNQVTHAVGRIWLNRDGQYYVFYNMGPQARPPDINGPFQVQGRVGAYTLREDGGVYQLCLWPAAPRTRIGAEVQHELFAEGACYRFNLHHPGDVWHESNDTEGRDYKLWLVRGR
jgi:hypothetical protein